MKEPKDTSPYQAHGGGEESSQGQGKTTWTGCDRSLGKLKWRVYHTPWRGGKREDLKRENPGGH
jgi:hypothetical protein